MNVDSQHLKLKTPFTMLVGGATGSGKTVLIRQILSDKNLFLPGNVLWAYGIWTKAYEEALPGTQITYFDGLPSQTDIQDSGAGTIVLDDLMADLGNDRKLANLFTRDSHHNNLNVIFIVQNIFHKGSQMRNISLNCHYIILMKSVRDRQQITTLGRQMYPSTWRHFVDAYNDSTSEPFGYLLIDLTPSTPDRLRLRTRITSINGISSPTIYVPR